MPRSRSSPAAPPPFRIFLLSPAHCGGLRANLVMSERARFPLARRLRAAPGVPLGEVFTFLSGLYFRGRLAYARVFARPPAGVAGIHVITPTSGILPADAPVTVSDLLRFGQVDIDEGDSRYRRPLERSVLSLVGAIPPACEIVMLGSIATGKYVDVLLSLLGPASCFRPTSWAAGT